MCHKVDLNMANLLVFYRIPKVATKIRVELMESKKSILREERVVEKKKHI
jgi:hypothetical protein